MQLRRDACARYNVELDVIRVLQNFSIEGLAHLIAELTGRDTQEPPTKPQPLPVPIEGAVSSSVVQTAWGMATFLFLSYLTGLALAPVLAVNGALNPEEVTFVFKNGSVTAEVRLGTWKLLALLPLYHLMVCTVVGSVTLCAKWSLIGSYCPGRHAVWSWYHCRCLFVNQLLFLCDLFFAAWIQSTPMLCVWYRLLGARVGSNVWLGSPTVHHPDLIEIGSHVSVDSQVLLAAGDVSFDGHVVVAEKIAIGDGATVCQRCVLAPGSSVKDNAIVSMGRTVGGGEADQPVHELLGYQTILHPEKCSRTLLVGFVVGYLIVVGIFETCIFCGATALDEINIRLGYVGVDAVLFLGVFFLVFVVSLSLAAVHLKWALLGRIRPGTLPIAHFTVWRFWISHVLLTLANNVAMPLFSVSVINNLYLRLLGAQVDTRDTLIADVSCFTIQADLLSLGPNTFIAGGVSMPCTRLDPEAGTVELSSTSIGNLCYVGHGSIVGPGCDVQPNVVIGDLAIVAVGVTVPEFSMILGESSVITSTGATVSTEDDPTVGWWFHPVRLMVTVYILGLATLSARISFEVLFDVIKDVGTLDGMGFLEPHIFFGPQPAQFCFVWGPLVGVVSLAVFGGLALVHKWVLLGRMAVGSYHPPHAIDSFFSMRYTVCSAAWMMFSFSLRSFAGTPLVSLVYNMMGAKVGEDVHIFSLDLGCDFDGLEFGDGAFIGPEVFFQCHVFLNNKVRFGPIVVGSSAVVTGCNSLFVSDTTLEPGASLGPGSLILRGETVPANEYLAKSSCAPSCSMLRSNII
eukprot:TRINITY_DN4553_c0_g1_i7.p1 TRINITY_DN4553_c0_g1~~TRINITY_DN4553_c0_g1_i7.p1  ORF type:complete len:797 (-),score=76.10 TRINITY_DN4553_c0_g1_i7:142-2532(-)